MTTRLFPAAALGCSALLLAACGSGDATRSYEEPSQPQRQPRTDVGDTNTNTTTSTTPAPAPRPQTGAVVEARGDYNDAPFTFRIVELVRRGPTVVVNATLSVAEGQEDQLSVDSMFDDGVDQELADETTEGTRVFDGIALVDPAGKRKYLVARDAQGRCVCSNDLGTIWVEPGETHSFSATLTAPPAGVNRVDVIVPNVRTFVDVPISA